MRCRRCGAQTQREASLCPVCGAELKGRRRAAVRCAACGGRAPSGATLCPVCGRRLRPSRRGWFAVIPAALLVVALVGLWPGSAGRGRDVARLGGGAAPTFQPSPTSTATPEVTVTAKSVLLATATPLATATCTQTPWPTATVTPSATCTATPWPTATAMPSPTITPTPLPATATATPTVALPTATPRPAATPSATTPPLSPAPQLLAPADGEVFWGQGATIWLRWQPVGQLREDEWYAVSLRYWANGGTQYAGSWEKEPQWKVPAELFQKYDPAHPGYEWDVVVMRQTGTRSDGGREGVPVSQRSATWRFEWR